MLRHLLAVIMVCMFTVPAWAQSAAQNAVKNVESYFSGLEGIVVAVPSPREVLIDLGRTSDIIAGTEFNLYQEDEIIVHPVTGRVLGRKESNIGKVIVTAVEEDYSVARFEGTGMPQVGNRVAVGKPAAVNVVYENATNEDRHVIGNALMANPVVQQVTENADYTINFIRVGDVLSYQIQQKSGLVVFTGSVAPVYRAAEAMKGFEVVKAGGLPEGEYVSIAAGKIFKDDPKTYVVAVQSGKADILDPARDFAKIAELSGTFNTIINVETADLDQDGTDEIFITNIFEGIHAVSMVYKHDATGFRRIQEEIPWMFRSVRQLDGSRILLGQQLSIEGAYKGEIAYIEYAGGQYTGGRKIPGTASKRLFGFSITKDKTSGEEMYIQIGNDSRLMLSTFSKILHRSGVFYGDTFHSVPQPRASRERSRQNSDEQVDYLDRMITVNPRIEIIDEDHFLLVQNLMYTRVLSKTPTFSKSNVGAYKYQNLLLQREAVTPELDPLVVDVWAYKDGETLYVLVLNTSSKWLFLGGDSRITQYKLTL